MKIKCASFCISSNGEPDIYYAAFDLTQDQIDDEYQYVLMKKLAKKEGFKSYLECDEDDPAGAVMQLCEWETIPVLDSKLKDVPQVYEVKKGDWNLISSAPRDGTVIDLWSPTQGRLTNYWRVALDKGKFFYESFRSEKTNTVHDATHWMETPNSP